MNERELCLSRQKQEQIAGRNFITAALQMTASIGIACYIYFIKKTPGDIGLYAGPCFVFGLLDIGIALFARYRIRGIQKREIVYKVMED